MSLVLTEEQIAQEKLKEFLESEFSDYSFDWKIERVEDYDEDGQIHFEVNYFNPAGSSHTLHFYYDTEKEDLFICMYEDIFQMVRFYDWSVKYFWMQVKWH